MISSAFKALVPWLARQEKVSRNGIKQWLRDSAVLTRLPFKRCLYDPACAADIEFKLTKLEFSVRVAGRPLCQPTKKPEPCTGDEEGESDAFHPKERSIR